MTGKINKDNFAETKHFCMLPWLHMHFWPDSTAHYCCISDTSKPVGTYSGDINKLVNSDNMKKIRQNMMNDLPSDECKRCYELEKNKVYSLRNSANSNYSQYFEDVEKTAADGSVEKFTMRYLDIRFSNLCNFRCRSCGPSLSTSWYADQKTLYPEWASPMLHEVSPKENFWNDLLPSLNYVEEAYFAGGEPLITDEIYKIMDYWLENGKTDVNIDFTTNFSRLSFKNKNIIDYWKKFPNVTVSASLDASGERAEYMRKGTVWNNIVENRKKMIQECPDVKFELTPTISLFNVWHFPDFHLEWIKAGLVDHTNLRLNILTNPSNMSFKLIKPSKRKIILEKWLDTLDEIVTLCDIDVIYFNKTVNGYKSVISALEGDEYTDLREEFYKRNNLIDKIRSEHLYKTFPELADLLAD